MTEEYHSAAGGPPFPRIRQNLDASIELCLDIAPPSELNRLRILFPDSPQNTSARFPL